jgi:hypothetical protein
MCHITTWEEDYKGNNTSPSLQSPLANSSSPSCTFDVMALTLATYNSTQRIIILHIVSARNGNLEMPVHFLKVKQEYYVRKMEKIN